MSEEVRVAELVPFTTFRYKVLIGDMEMGFSEVSSMDATVDVIEYREGWMNPTPKKFPGMVKYGNLTLKKGLTTSYDLYNWIAKDINEGGYDKRDITIQLVDTQGSPLVEWNIANAWVTKYTTPDFKASSGELAFESIELAHEGWSQTITDGKGYVAIPNSGVTSADGGEPTTSPQA